MFADQGITGDHQVVHPEDRGQVQPGPGRRGEPDAVELHHLIRKQRQLVPHDIDPAWCALSPAAGQVDAPVLLQPAGQRCAPEPRRRTEAEDGTVVEVGVGPQRGGPSRGGARRDPDAAGNSHQVLR
ncbi:hypothetical protein AR539_04875 [Arthrobacter sp. EPSL27]|nr:hypothetical protein AR539_04875 [Arthrobacter sp. EPSL27]